MSWAQRLKRVFNIDIETCSECGGAMKVIACIEDPEVIKQILDHLEQKAETSESRALPERRAPPVKLPLRLIQDGAPTELIQKTTSIRFSKFPLVEIFKRYIMVIGKGMPHQSGLAGLARPGDHNHWIAVGEVLKPGFCVPGDVGHGGFWLLYMPAP
jgi:hypothetical protein